ncbi:MAG: hypothetical protein JW861_12690 [Bacteroidales bacterium]|nr:hypothetical protein [Bacteroidales bacterium]
MKKVDTSRLSHTECWGIQINGLTHCRNINCRWQGLTACEGQNIIRTGRNSLGYRIGELGLIAGDWVKPEQDPDEKPLGHAV